MLKRKIWIGILLALISFKLYMVIGSANVYNDENWEGSTVYLIPSTHSDQYWKGEWDGPNMGTLHDNLMEALDMIAINPDFRYTVDQASILATFLEENPHYETRLKNAINKGQVEVVGGGLSQADLNIPSGEGLIRNELIGNSWLEQELGTTTQVAWQVDTFGAPSTAPSLMAAMDYKYLYYKRDARGYPEGAFWWTDEDGGVILCWKTHYGRYPITAPDMIAMINNYINDDMAESLPSGNFMIHIGGDKLAPLTAIMDYIETWNTFYAKETGYRVKVATPSEFFTAIDEEAVLSLPVYGNGEDTNPYNEGAIISYLETKVLSREWESKASTAEIFSTFGSSFLNIDSIQTPDELEAGWYQNCFSYHHDSVTGTSPDYIIADIIEDYYAQQTRANNVLDQSLQGFAKEITLIDNYTDTAALVVFNSESQYRNEIITTTVPLNQSIFPEYTGGAYDPSKLEIAVNDTKSDLPVAAQIISVETPDSNMQEIADVEISFMAEVDSVGYRVFTYNFTYNEPEIDYNGIICLNNSNTVNISNGIYNISWNMDIGGNIDSLIFDETEQIPEGESIGLAIFDSSNSPYDADIKDLLYETKDYEATYEIEKNQLYTTLLVSVELLWYELEIEYKIYLNSTKIDVVLDFHHFENQGSVAHLLQMNWPWDDSSAEWYCGAPYGWTEHTADKSRTVPFPATMWSTIENDTYGLAIYDRGSLARDWNTNEQCMSLGLVHQNDPAKNAPGSDTYLAEYEYDIFNYNEIDDYSLEFAFEYYSSSWKEESIPQKGREYNSPLNTIGIVTEKMENEFSASLLSDFEATHNYITPYDSTALPNWGSLVQINSTNVAFTAFKSAELDNGLVFRLLSYPYDAEETEFIEDIELTFFENLPVNITPDTAKLVSGLENEFNENPADLSLSIIPMSYNISSAPSVNPDNLTLLIPRSVLREELVRTFYIPITEIDVLAPDIEWKSNNYAIMGMSVDVELEITDSSEVEVSGYYTEDSGVTWIELPEFSIQEKESNKYTAVSTIKPTNHGEIRFQIKVVDASGNVKQMGYFNTSYTHSNIIFGESSGVMYHSPQIRALWPLYTTIPIIALLALGLWLLIRKSSFQQISKAKNNSETVNDSQENEPDELKEKDRDTDPNYLIKFEQKIEDFKQKIGSTGVFTVVLFLGLSLLSFILQTNFVFDYNDLVNINWTDEWILDQVQFIHRNGFYVPIYLISCFVSILIFTFILKLKKNKEMPMYTGLLIFIIPLIIAGVQTLFYLINGTLSTIPAQFVINEIFNLYIDPVLILAHILAIFTPILIPRLFKEHAEQKENGELVEEHENQIIIESSERSIDSDLSENTEDTVKLEVSDNDKENEVDLVSKESNSIENEQITETVKNIEQLKKNTKKKSKSKKRQNLGEKIFVGLHDGFWYLVQFAVLCYFSTIIFVDYFTRYLGGEAFGNISRSQAYTIWCYYAFLIVLFLIMSIIFALFHEVALEKLKNPFKLKNRFKLIILSQIVSVFAAYFYYTNVVQDMTGITTIDPNMIFLYLPAIFLSVKTLFFIAGFVAVPHVVIHLLFYPVNRSISNRKQKIRAKKVRN